MEGVRWDAPQLVVDDDLRRRLNEQETSLVAFHESADDPHKPCKPSDRPVVGRYREITV